MSRPVIRFAVLVLMFASAPLVSYVSYAAEPAPKVQPRKQGSSPQQIIVEIKLVEVDRQKMRKLGFDFAPPEGSELQQVDSEMVFNHLSPKPIADDAEPFTELLDSLVKNKVARILAEPEIETCVGHEAVLKVGKNMKVTVPQAGFVSKEDKFLGTQLNVKPSLTENNRVILDIRFRYAELCAPMTQELNSQSRIHVHGFETGFEVDSGKTLVLPRDGEQYHVHQTAQEVEEIVLDKMSFVLVTATLVDEQTTQEEHADRTARTVPALAPSYQK